MDESTFDDQRDLKKWIRDLDNDQCPAWAVAATARALLRTEHPQWGDDWHDFLVASNASMILTAYRQIVESAMHGLYRVSPHGGGVRITGRGIDVYCENESEVEQVLTEELLRG
jgi:hypothetical protein